MSNYRKRRSYPGNSSPPRKKRNTGKKFLKGIAITFTEKDVRPIGRVSQGVIGIKLDKLTNIVKWDGNQFFDSSVIMKNGTLICNIKDIPQYEKQLIFMTDEGLPFTLLAIETAGEISDRGAN